MTTMYLIRHAQAEGNIYRRYQGWYNGLITPHGYRQIEALEKRFADIPIDAAYSSDLARTMTTAGAVCKPKGLPLHTDPGLREIGGGVWENRTWAQLRRADPAFFDRFAHADPTWKVEGGETYVDVQERMVRTLRRIAAENEGRSVAVFSHGTAIRVSLAKYSGYPPSEIQRMPQGDNTAVSKLLFDGERVEIVFCNDSSHLKDLSAPRLPGWETDDAGFVVSNLWFRPLDFKTEADFYHDSRLEAWSTIHHTQRGARARDFLAEARTQAGRDPESVLAAMRGEERAGILQLDIDRDAQLAVGNIPFFYITPEYRCRGLGVQLLGQAVATYRALGRSRLRLRCSPENDRALRFYERYGFHKIGREAGGLGELDVLEMPIVL